MGEGNQRPGLVDNQLGNEATYETAHQDICSSMQCLSSYECHNSVVVACSLAEE